MIKLKYTIPLLGLVLSVAIIGFEYMSLSADLTKREIFHAHETLANAANALQGNLNDHLKTNNMDGVREDISDVGFLSSARLTYLLNETDTVIASGELQLVGSSAASLPHAIDAKLLYQVRSKQVGKIVEAEAGKILISVYPVIMGRHPGELRPSRIGIVVIEYDMSNNLARLQTSVLKSTGDTAMVVIFLILVVGVVMRFLMTARVARILTVAQDYISGNRFARVGLKGVDEFAAIGRAFDGVADDIEATQTRLRNSQKSLNNAQRIAHLGNWEWDIRSGHMTWSDEVFRIYGYEPQEFSPTYEIFINAMHADDRDTLKGQVERALAEKTDYTAEHRIVHPDGENRVVYEIGELELAPDGEPMTMNGTVLDITERHQAEQSVRALNEGLERTMQKRTAQLRDSEAKTRQIVNSAVDGIITIDEKGIVVGYNNAAEHLFGYSVIEIIGKNVSMLMPKNIATNHDQYLRTYLETGKAHILGRGREVVGLRKGGMTFLMELSVSEFRNADDSITFVGIIRDITARKEAEYKLQSTLEALQNTQDELVQSAKMASLGGLVAGVAHEINTPLGVGLTAITHLREQATDLAEKFVRGLMKKSDFQNFVDMATQSTTIVEVNLNRASDLIRSFKQVAVDQTSEEKRQINLLGYIDEVLESLKPNLKRTHHEITVSGDRDIVIDTHPGAVSQIITNFVMNSVIHAYDEGQDGHIQITATQDNNIVSLIYSDDGKGMEEDVCAKIFEPFFTTKRGSGGSGLGMHILYNQVIQTLGGSIVLRSTPGQGAVFEISIPLNTSTGQKGKAQ